MSGSRYHYNDATGQPKTGPNSKPPARHRMKYAERVRQLKLRKEQAQKCTLEEFNLMLWPKKKPPGW
jgi:hypothetical protein